MKAFFRKLTDFFREDNGGLSCIRLSLIFGVVVLVPGFIAACYFCEHLQGIANELFLFVGSLAGVKAYQKGKEADGKDGNTNDATGDDEPTAKDQDSFLGLVSGNAPADTIPDACVRLILEAEGIDQPSKVPPGDSGVSIGRGYDLGYEKNFREDWAGVLGPIDIQTLASALGKKGAAARAIAPKFRAIHITQAEADEVFHSVSLPREIAKARDAFPGYDRAPGVVQGVLVSLGYNRGFAMKDEPGSNRRLEMRQIRDAVAAGHYADVPKYLRAMKRLWPAGSGLITRREAEAKLVEGCL